MVELVHLVETSTHCPFFRAAGRALRGACGGSPDEEAVGAVVGGTAVAVVAEVVVSAAVSSCTEVRLARR